MCLKTRNHRLVRSRLAHGAAGDALPCARASTPNLPASGAPQDGPASRGAGILDPAGNEIMRDVTTYGPSLLRQFGSKAIPWVMRAADLSWISYELLKHLVNIAKD